MDPVVAWMPVTAAGIGLIRLGWCRRRTLVVLGWTLVAAGVLALLSLTGAWGIAIAGTAAVVAALVILLREAWATPRGRTAPLREPPSITLPRPTLKGIGRRCAVFALVVPIGLAATTLLGFGAQAMARRAGWGEADTTALALLLQPMAWTALACIQLTRPRTTAMIAPALGFAAAGLLLWWPL